MKGRNLLIAILAATLASCSSVSLSLLQYDQLAPASLSLPQEIKKVAIIDRLNTTTKYALHDLSISSAAFVESLGLQLAEADYFDDVLLCDSDVSYIDRNDSIILPLTQRNVRRLAEDLDVDMLVSVEHVSASVVNVVFMPIVTVQAVAKAYIPSRQGALRNLVVSDTLTWSNELGEVSHEIMLHDVTAFAAEKIAHQLAPYWEPAERVYFSGGNANFRDAEMFLKRGDWDMVRSLWEETLTSAKGLLALQVRYNLVLAKEMSGDVEGAYNDCTALMTDCAGHAELLRMATLYQSVLKKRITSQQMLQLQLQRFD